MTIPIKHGGEAFIPHVYFCRPFSFDCVWDDFSNEQTVRVDKDIG